MPLNIECTKCGKEIYDSSDMVQIIEDAGFTATYCTECGVETKKILQERDRSIK
ncbi:MAG: hypothetical protein ABIH83_04520 [Candidatus Micrarchaeota archaeon]